MAHKNEYDPDYAVPPGETLLETAGYYFAERAGIDTETWMDITEEGGPITPEIAAKLEGATGVPARLWLNLERQYRERLKKIQGA